MQLGYNPGPQLLDAVSRRAYQMLHQYSLQELSHLLWALAIFEHYPGPPTCRFAIAEHVAGAVLYFLAHRLHVWPFRCIAISCVNGSARLCMPAKCVS